MKAILETVGTYKPGDAPPVGYINWHEWARVQTNAGLRQRKCGKCGLWKFPQEMSDLSLVSWASRTKHGQSIIKLVYPVCLECAKQTD